MGFSLKMLSEQTLSVEDISYLSKLLNGEEVRMPKFDFQTGKSTFSDNSIKLKDGDVLVIEGIHALNPVLTERIPDERKFKVRFEKRAQEGKKELLNSLAYPLILLFITMTSLYLFDLYGIDSIFSLISSFEADIELFDSLRIAFRIMINIFYYLVLLMFILALFFFKPANVIMLYIFVSRHLPNSLLNIHYSQEFMALFLICCEAGYKTRQALEILKAMTSKPVISFLAFHLDESLMEGESLKEATRKNYYDSSLSRFIKIANYTNDFSEVIGSYVELSREKIRRRMKRYTNTIQMMTYVFIGFIIIFIYQILFMPMQAISLY